MKSIDGQRISKEKQSYATDNDGNIFYTVEKFDGQSWLVTTTVTAHDVVSDPNLDDSLILLGSNNYSVNALNQYTSINQGTSVSPVHDLDGNAK